MAAPRFAPPVPFVGQAAALPQIHAEAEELRETLAALKNSLRLAPFEKTPTEMVALRQRVRDLEDEVETLDGVAEETKRRMNDAFRAEQRAEVTKRMAKATAARAELQELFGRFDGLVDGLEKVIAKIGPLNSIVRVENEFARTRGCEDLQIRCPTAPTSVAPLQALRAQSLTRQFEALKATGRL